MFRVCVYATIWSSRDNMKDNAVGCTREQICQATKAVKHQHRYLAPKNKRQSFLGRQHLFPRLQKSNIKHETCRPAKHTFPSHQYRAMYLNPQTGPAPARREQTASARRNRHLSGPRLLGAAELGKILVVQLLLSVPVLLELLGLALGHLAPVRQLCRQTLSIPFLILRVALK